MMRLRYLRLSLIIAAAFMAASALCITDTQCAEAQPAVQAQTANSVVVYYFHTNYRCTNCHNMENWTKELLDKHFKNEMDAGILVFKMVNMEEKGNEHYVSDYRLYTKTVLLSIVKDGKEVRIDNLIKVWEFLNSKEKFQRYVEDAITKSLREI